MSRQYSQPYSRPERGSDEEFNRNDSVEVHIRANFWVVGFVIGGLQFFRMLAGWGYEVEFTSPCGQRKRDIFCPKDVRHVT